MDLMRKRRYKTRVGILIGVVLVLLLLNNFAGQESYAHMKKGVNAIYADRLMPTTFLFRLREHLYEERVLLQTKERNPESLQELRKHRSAIAALVFSFEKTLLTTRERGEWNRLKSRLALRDRTFSPAAASSEEFAQLVQVLNNLIVIQAEEGAHLNEDVASAIDMTALRSDLEIIVLIIFGCVMIARMTRPRPVAETPSEAVQTGGEPMTV